MEALLAETQNRWAPPGRPPSRRRWHISILELLSRPPRTRWLRPFFHVFDLASSLVVGCVYFLLARQPRRQPLLLSRPLAWLIRFPIKRPILRRLRTVLPDETRHAAQLDRLWREFLDHVGFSLVEPLRLARMNDPQLREHITLSGEEHLHSALGQGRGVMLFINHLGESGCVPALGRFGYDISVVTDPMPIPFFERLVDRLYTAASARRLVVGGRIPVEVARVFRRNGVLAAYTDIALSPRHGEWFAFGAAEVRLHPGPAILAVRHRVPVLYVNTVRLPGNHHEVIIHPPLKYDPEGDFNENVHSLLQQSTDLLLAEVQCRPAQWWALDFVDVRPRRSWPVAEVQRPAQLNEAIPGVTMSTSR